MQSWGWGVETKISFDAARVDISDDTTSEHYMIYEALP